ncbi:hypothetical protein ES703_06147 [subsurface metagenome]
MSKWATPSRQAHLVNLFIRSKGFCVFGDRPCPTPTLHHYDPFAEGLIADWKACDREEDKALWEAERKALHGLAERGALRGQFSAIGRDIFFSRQPEYYLDGLGISGLTFRPFAKVRLASSFVCLHVEIGDALHATSKARKRKAIRYGKPLPQEARGEIDRICRLAVKHYLK